MSEHREARQLLEMAEHAAIDGDYSSADELLRDAARIQEAELGPRHPDLTHTLNNLAIIAERTGRPGDAETLYRRAAAIASASLPPDHPTVSESRRNLEDFCRERGVPITVAGPQIRPPPSGTPSPVPRTPAPTAPRSSWRQLAWVAIGAIVLVIAAVLVMRPSSPHDTPTAPPAASQASEPALPPSVLPAPIEQAQPSSVEPRNDGRAVVTDRPASSVASSGTISLTTVELCQAFSTGGGSWRCDPAGDPVARGAIVLYTRVRSLRDSAVVHRWYREDTLRQAVRLTIRASTSDGYRTYSRQTVDGAGNWRVEVRSANGDLLHEQRFAVR